MKSLRSQFLMTVIGSGILSALVIGIVNRQAAKAGYLSIETGAAEAILAAESKELRAVCDVARVPLRDHGLALELDAVPEMAALPVDPGPTCRLVVAVLRLLGTEHSGSAAGQVRLTATAVGSEVLLRFAATAGHGAPLPRDPTTASEALRSELLASAARQQPGPDLWFAFPALQPTLRAP